MQFLPDKGETKMVTDISILVRGLVQKGGFT
jgi:hypothetical protein